MKAKKTLLKYITVGGLMLCLAVVLVPFYIIISNSFKPYAEIAKHIFSLPQDFTTKNYSEAWRRLNFANSLKNTVIISVLSNFGGVVFSSMCGYWITRHQNQVCFFYADCVYVHSLSGIDDSLCKNNQ